jgi:hypothetical protein
MVLKNVSTAALSANITLPLIDALEAMLSQVFW